MFVFLLIADREIVSISTLSTVSNINKNDISGHPHMIYGVLKAHKTLMDQSTARNRSLMVEGRGNNVRIIANL